MSGTRLASLNSAYLTLYYVEFGNNDKSMQSVNDRKLYNMQNTCHYPARMCPIFRLLQFQSIAFTLNMSMIINLKITIYNSLVLQTIIKERNNNDK